MIGKHFRQFVPVAVGLVGALDLPAQGFEVSYGSWWYGDRAIVSGASLYRSLGGSLSYGIGVFHIDDSRSVTDRTSTGGELALALGRDGTGLYVLASGGLSVRHEDGDIDAFWVGGVGYALRPLSFVSVDAGVRYRYEDRRLRGFWQLDGRDRQGLELRASLTIGSGTSGARGRPRRRTGGSPEPTYQPPSGDELFEAARDAGASADVARTAQSVVETALSAMGTPYEWGGNDENGFDCSGLIKYAYEQHGIILPRVSRDQARVGRPVESRVTALRPGDILGFSIEGDRVTHVGLYVGDGRFIHSA
ncbi:MAG: C40 family peptidase, partial [Gemmatimonadales bacterium]